jgi:hypothetical protein
MTVAQKRSYRSPAVVVAVVAAALVGIVGTGGPADADVTAVSGSATALSVGGTPTASVSGSASEAANQDGYGPIGSGFLPSGVVCPSGSIVPPLGLPVLLSVGLLDACTRGGGVLGENHFGFAESSAAVADVVIGGAVLGVVRSACRADGDGAVGSTEIIGSGIPGLPTNPAPNTVVGVPGILPLGQVLTLTLNEQVVNNNPGVASITVNGVRLNLLGIDIILAQSVCQATGPNVNQPTIPPTTTTTAPPTTTTPTTTTPTTTTPTTTTPTTPPPTAVPPTTTTLFPPGNVNNNVNTNVNTNVNSNVSNNTNTLTGGNNVNTNTVQGNTINITSPPSQVVFHGPSHTHSHTQSQTQSQTQIQ